MEPPCMGRDFGARKWRELHVKEVLHIQVAPKGQSLNAISGTASAATSPLQLYIVTVTSSPICCHCDLTEPECHFC